jgi:coenzyme F420-dependent glucose-6-phosphate dehydrogenase
MALGLGYSNQPDMYPPRELLEHVALAEKAGFEKLWVGDHFMPWSHSEAHESHAWVFIGAAAAMTRKMQLGTAVTCPLFRYHPGITAQAFATLRAMFPERIFLGLGTGEAVNEVPLGYEWPSVKERLERTEEAIKIMKLLWSENFVSFKGKYYRLRKANLYSKPETPVPIYLAAFGPKVAKLAGMYCDGFLTSLGDQPLEHVRDVLFSAVDEGAKEKGRDPSKLERVAELVVAYDEDYDKALKKCRLWAGPTIPIMFPQLPIYDPREIEACGRLISNEVIARSYHISTKPEQIIRTIESIAKIGFSHVYLVSFSPDERAFIRMAEKEIVPYVKSNLSL